MTQPLQRSTPSRIFRAVWEKLWWLLGITLMGGFFLLAIKNPALLVRLFSMLFIAIGIAMPIYVETKRRRQRLSRTWKPVQGRIMASEVKEKRLRSGSRQGGPLTWGATTTYFPSVVYAYNYMGKAYQAEGIITININWPKKEAEAAVARYTVDTAVTVWVNPDLPHQAVLEPGLSRYSKKYKLGFLIGIAFIMAGTAGLFLASLLH